jgi:L-asparaginase
VKIQVLTTGGTIEKIYSEQSGTVQNVVARINQYIAQLRLPDTQIEITQLMNKDSLEMTDFDRETILDAVCERVKESPVVITHGTDTMVTTGRLLKSRLVDLKHPVILTGAMTPLGFERTDGLQNLTESLFAARTLLSGVWIVLHNQAFDVDRVRKDRERAQFVAEVLDEATGRP